MPNRQRTRVRATTTATTTRTATDVRRRELRRERTDALFRDAECCPPESRSRIHQHIVIDHLGLAEAIARRYAGGTRDWSDIKQVAYLGLVKAVKRFQPALGSEFVAYAVPTISGEVKRHLRDNGWFIRPPRHVQELRARVREAEPRLAQRLQREPSRAELAADLGESVERIGEACDSGDNLRLTSLDQPVDGSDGSAPLSDALGADDAGIGRFEELASIAPACRRLTARDRRILYLRFFEERTQAQIGRELSVTQMQVSRLLASILERVRADLASDAVHEQHGTRRVNAHV